MLAAVVILGILIVILILYIAFLKLQLKSITKQLVRRLKEHTREPINIELLDHDLNVLASNINRCLKAEEDLRLNSIRDEKHFKEMIANVSHDLRTPLTAIKGYQQLMEKGGLDSEQEKKLKIAEKHADELGSLIEHFFEYSYLVNAEPKLNLSKINLNNLVAECIAASVSDFEKRGLSVNIKDTSYAFAAADREMTVRIVQNLIRNCIAHSMGDVEVTILTREKAVVSFKNPVKNPDKIDTKRLFERFYTGDPAREKSTGLGLSIVKLLTEMMGGEVGADLDGNMIEIWFSLPLCK